MQTMYSGKVNSPATTLDGGVNNTVTTIDIIDGSVLPSAPNLAVIGTGEDAETILYATKVGNQLSNVTRGFQGIAKEWSTGEAISRLFTEYDYSALKDNIETLADRPIGAQLTISGEEAFSGTSPTSWTDLDLSSIVGENPSFVLLSIISSVGSVHLAVRKNGDTTEYFSGGVGNAGGVAFGVSPDANIAIALNCVTDNNGVIEWKCDSARTNTVVSVIAYIK